MLAASLRGVVKHQGVRCVIFVRFYVSTALEHVLVRSGLVTRFPLLVALVSAFAFFSVTCIILAACFLPDIVKRSSDALVRTETPTTPITPLEPVDKRQLISEFEDDEPPKRIKRSRRSRSRSTDDGFVGYLPQHM